LNELIDELERYQSKSVDRSSRVGDSAVAQEPIEKHLSDFFHGRDDEEKEKLADGNVAMIALPDQGENPNKDGGDDTGGGDDPPARPGDPGDKKEKTGLSAGGDTTTFGFGSRRDLSSLRQDDVNQGVRRSSLLGNISHAVQTTEDKVEKRSHIFRRFNR